MGLNANVKYMDEAMDRSMIAEPKISKILSESLNMPEEEAVQDLLGALQWDDALSGGTHDYAVELVQRIRKTKRKAGSLEAFFQQYSLSTKEGLALMSMAEALLRIPDVKTANALIRDKIAGTNWLKNSGNDKDWMAKATSLGLTLSSGTMNSLFSKVGEPVIREAIGKAMKILGKQFVIGETMAGAMRVAQKWEGKKAQGKGSYRFSYDMLGEGARTDRDAQRYFDGYKGALLDLADSVKKRGDLEADERAVRPGISVKLSALHPRYELAQEDICVPELTDRLVELCRIAAPLNIGLTIDAEEMARLGLSLKTIENICADSQFKGWDGFGLAVQAYHKAAPDVIDHIIHLAKTYERKMQIRLVKGAYWDSEIKHAQIEGFENYPVYTRKLNTDLSYLRCAQKMMRNRDVLYPMFGTHNAYSVAAIMKMDEGGAPENRGRYEFQKLYGMGDSLYDHIAKDHPETTICVYAPVGPYPDLLPYLVRRMLENGANSSFVNQIYDSDFEPSEIVSDPVEKARGNDPKYHPKIPLPKNLYGEQRVNSKGWDLDDEAVLEGLRAEIEGRFKTKNYAAMPLIAGKKYKDGVGYDKQNPAYLDDVVGHIYDAKMDHMQKAFDVAHQGYQMWSVTPASHRAKVLERFANLMEENTAELMALCIREGGKTYRDARDEIREAVDFCRYYALRGRLDFVPEGKKLVGPTGETDILKLEPRGIFICISPWNFPLAIFTGQVVAALMAGNAVIAKPAEQTSLIGFYTAELLIKAGLPSEVLTLLPGDGRIGAALVAHKDVGGVAFTGSTEVARSINRTLAEKDGPIVPFIAETGGLNAMIVDSSALTEQVIDDVVRSAFGSAGQRCSACRIMLVQEEVADKTILMLQGAMEKLRVKDPAQISSDVGPIIDEEALTKLQQHKTRLAGMGKKIASSSFDPDLRRQGHFFAPLAYELSDLDMLKEEVFGPILHVVRYKAREIDQVIDALNETGYGLTFGVHSRINSFIYDVSNRMRVGNVYVNRSTIGAVVGVQPFGGRGLSGTGPKAGGPHYLHAFATEKVVSTDTTAAGGNASLVMIGE